MKVEFSNISRDVQEIQKQKLIQILEFPVLFLVQTLRYHHFIVLWITPTLDWELGTQKQECLM
jgi:hypothetical protein